MVAEWREHRPLENSNTDNSEVVFDLVAGMFERLRLDGAVPWAALPVVFLPAVVNPGRERHLKAATQTVQVRFVDLAKLSQFLRSIGIVVDRHAAPRQFGFDAVSIFRAQTIGILGAELRI